LPPSTLHSPACCPSPFPSTCCMIRSFSTMVTVTITPPNSCPKTLGALSAVLGGAGEAGVSSSVQTVTFADRDDFPFDAVHLANDSHGHGNAGGESHVRMYLLQSEHASSVLPSSRLGKHRWIQSLLGESYFASVHSLSTSFAASAETWQRLQEEGAVPCAGGDGPKRGRK